MSIVLRIEQHPIVDHEQWLAQRRRDVTASRIGGLYGIHPYVTALRIYAEKRGVEFVEQENAVMRRGRWLEPAVAKAVGEKRPDWTLEAPNVYLRAPELRLGATPDFYIKDDPRGRGVLQAKTVAPSVYHRDWADGAEVPFWITLQCLTEMMLSDAAFGAVAVLLVDPHFMDVNILEVPRNEIAEAKIIAAVRDFWRMVDDGREPEPDYGRDTDVIKALAPRESPGKSIDLAGNNELPALLDQRAQLRERIRSDESRCEAIETEIKFLLRDSESATGLPGWRISFKTTHYKEYTVTARDRRVLRITDKRKSETAHD